MYRAIQVLIVTSLQLLFDILLVLMLSEVNRMSNGMYSQAGVLRGETDHRLPCAADWSRIGVTRHALQCC